MVSGIILRHAPSLDYPPRSARSSAKSKNHPIRRCGRSSASLSRAAGINFADLVARTGMYQDAPSHSLCDWLRSIWCHRPTGAGVQGFSVGDRVLAMPKFMVTVTPWSCPQIRSSGCPTRCRLKKASAAGGLFDRASHDAVRRQSAQRNAFSDSLCRRWGGSGGAGYRSCARLRNLWCGIWDKSMHS